jgi:hypothetical protein
MILRHQIIRKSSLLALLCVSMIPAVAMAGDQANAQAAIAVARGKIAAGDKVGTNRMAPELQEQARVALREAQDLLDNHHKKEAQAAAIRAGDLADQALVSGDNRRAQIEQTRRLDTQQATINAQQSAASANLRANSAEAMGNAANQRAEESRLDAINANARTDALRVMPTPATPATAPTPQIITTTITQQDVAGETAASSSRSVSKRVAPVSHKAGRHHARKAPRRHGHSVTVVTTSQR